MCELMIIIVLAGFLLNGSKSKYCVLQRSCAGVAEVPGAGCTRLPVTIVGRLEFITVVIDTEND